MRLGAQQINMIKTLLTINGVNLVAVGFEHTGAEEFIKRKFFDGGLVKLNICVPVLSL